MRGTRDRRDKDEKGARERPDPGSVYGHFASVFMAKVGLMRASSSYTTAYKRATTKYLRKTEKKFTIKCRSSQNFHLIHKFISIDRANGAKMAHPDRSFNTRFTDRTFAIFDGRQAKNDYAA